MSSNDWSPLDYSCSGVFPLKCLPGFPDCLALLVILSVVILVVVVVVVVVFVVVVVVVFGDIVVLVVVGFVVMVVVIVIVVVIFVVIVVVSAQAWQGGRNNVGAGMHHPASARRSLEAALLSMRRADRCPAAALLSPL